MMIKVNDEYLDFDGEIDVEKQAKFFDLKSTVSGDFSYQGILKYTSHNLKKLGFPLPDTSNKIIYNKIASQLINENGDVLFYGYLRVDGVNVEGIQFSFFSGNNNWMSLLSGNLTDLDFSEYNTTLTGAYVSGFANCSEDVGIVLPLVDNGGLTTRSDSRLLVEDLVAGIYVKTVIKKIFYRHGIKIQGELFDEIFYNGLITLTNNKNKEDIDANSCFVEKANSQPSADPITSLFYTQVLFDNDSSYPYFDGANNNFNLTTDRYVAPIKMIVEVDAFIKVDCNDFLKTVYIVKNGDVSAGARQFESSWIDDTVSIKRRIKLDAGDYIEIFMASPCVNILSGTLKITPTYLYDISGVSLVPKWTQGEYVDNIFRIFNVITSYDPISATLTVNLFNLIKQKTPIDLSEFISNVDVDYIDFISNYGVKNLLSYKQVDFGEVRDYNVRKYFKYAQGNIQVDNEFLEKSQDLVTSDFSNPLSYINGVFGGMSIEKTDLISIDEGDSQDATIDNLAGEAQFNIAENIFNIGDLVRVSDSTDPSYDGEWIVSNKSSGKIRLYGVAYITNETCRITQLFHNYSDKDDVFLLYNLPCYDIADYSNITEIKIIHTGVTSYPVAYFSLLNIGLPINWYAQSLSFGEIENELFYQRTIVDTYWPIVKSILNDPVKLICETNLPYSEFIKIDFLNPIEIKTLETSNLYYLNRITGYKNSYIPCIMELIKL